MSYDETLADLQNKFTQAIVDVSKYEPARYNEACVERVKQIAMECLGDIEDHIETKLVVRGTEVLINYIPKDDIGEAWLRKMGIIQTLNEPLECITINIDISK